MIHFKIIAVRDTLSAPSSVITYPSCSFGSSLFVFALLATAGVGASSVNKKPSNSDLIVCEGMACLGAFDSSIQLRVPEQLYHSFVSGNPSEVNSYSFLSPQHSTREPNCISGAITIARSHLDRSSSSSKSKGTERLLSTFINVQTFGQLEMCNAPG